MAHSPDTERIRQIYEARPYPGTDEDAPGKGPWWLAPMEWINALWKPSRGAPPPRRILIAGCGTGSEAFAMERCFPEAKIVAVDFSPRSISIARQSQQRAPETRSIRFLVANLASRQLPEETSGNFDFISCHGVLSYVPAPERVLRNLTRCLRSDGALYLGVNGAEHSSVAGRKFLPKFGFDMAELSDRNYLRRLLKLFDAILANRGIYRMANKNAGYLAGDLFGPLIHNLPLSDWLRMAREAGLHFQSNYSCHYELRVAMEKNFPQLLIPRSRPEICELLEMLRPARFHRLLFTRHPIESPPWENEVALLAWRPTLTNLYTVRLPKHSRSWNALRQIRFKSPATNTRLDWQMPEWEVEIVRRSDGERALDELLDQVPVAVSTKLLRQQLYVLHNLMVINLLSSNRPVKASRRRAL